MMRRRLDPDDVDDPYPFGDAGNFEENCACQFHCFPQLGANYDAVTASRTKVGFAEFTSASTPPRKYLQIDTTWKCFVAGTGTGFFWEKIAVDRATGGETTTESSPPFSTCAAASATPSVTTTRTTRRTIWTKYVTGSSGPVESRLEKIEVLSKEYTTGQLIADTIADLADWAEDFPAEPPSASDGIHAYFVSSGICYNKGDALWNTGASRLILVGKWSLATNELTFAVQRVRYRVAFPTLLGADSTFEVQWEEVFIPDDAGSEDDWETVANSGSSGDAGDAVSDILAMIEKQSNGEVYAMNARYTALG